MGERHDSGDVSGTDRVLAELEELRSRTLELRHELRRSRFGRMFGAAVVLCVTAAFVGYFLGSAGAEAQRAELRREVMKAYFAADHQEAGQRKQILSFVKHMVADDDPRLTRWLRSEQKAIEREAAEANEVAPAPEPPTVEIVDPEQSACGDMGSEPAKAQRPSPPRQVHTRQARSSIEATDYGF